MKKLIGANSPFLIPYFTFLIIAGFIILIYPKGEIHLYLNQFHNNFGDYFFYNATYAGDGLAVVGMGFLLCFFKYRFAILVALSNIASSLFTQLLKHTVFSDIVRPKKFFESTDQLNLIPWVENYLYNSFPSGHTTAAFTTFFCLALIIENKLLKFLMLVIALTIGFSRIYLSQHFLNDVYAGSLIGVTTSILVFYYLVFSEKSMKLLWMEKSFLKK